MCTVVILAAPGPKLLLCRSASLFTSHVLQSARVNLCLDEVWFC